MHTLHCNQLYPQLEALCRTMYLAALLALPAITPPMLAQFEADVAATGSEKEQRLIMRKLLMQTGTFHVSAIPFVVD